MSFQPRPSQQAVLAYQGGPLGIAAVPGAGKTFTLSALAAQILASGSLQPDQEVLIVTLVNSAVENFSNRIASLLNQQSNVFPNLGYRVRTLHGLAHDIVRERPSQAGLEERFMIVDEGEATLIRKDAVQTWLNASLEAACGLLDPQKVDAKRQSGVISQNLPALLDSVAVAFIRSAKNYRLQPQELRQRLDSCPAPLTLAEMAVQIYAEYQRALAYRGAVDFDDLIRLALDLLENAPDFLERLRYRYPFVLEDEAQDSSLLQEQILRLLSGPGGNWVRVGDPNQAIFETFTTASPRWLREFIENNPSATLPESGRSQPSIIAAANALISWTQEQHPNPQARPALTPPFILPAPPDDPQPNPPDDPSRLYFDLKPHPPAEELEKIAVSVQKFCQSLEQIPQEQRPTIAILDTTNRRAAEMAQKLRERGLEFVELLSTTDNTRRAAGSLTHLLQYLADPPHPGRLSKAYQVLRREHLQPNLEPQRKQPYLRVAQWLGKCSQVEDFLAPNQPEETASPSLPELSEDEAHFFLAEIASFRTLALRWLEAVHLPIDQLLLTLGADIFTQPADLALTHKLALALRQASALHPEWRLPQLAAELALIAKNERRFVGFTSDDLGFDPNAHRGKPVLCTMHRAKGLEWDRVYLLSVNTYNFPTGLGETEEAYQSEKWFVRDSLNLEAETQAQLDVLLQEKPAYQPGQATLEARQELVRERLRLLYVGLTRARREVMISSNTGKNGNCQPAAPLRSLNLWNKNR